MYAALLGVSFGSFALATSWRLRKKKNFVRDTSECEFCHHKLAARDLVPLVSWLVLRGRCRFCHHKLTVLLPIAEVVGALFFTASYLWWPQPLQGIINVTSFTVWYAALVLLLILFFYDLQWYLLPNKVMYPLWGLAVLYAGLQLAQGLTLYNAGMLALSVGIAWGLFFALFYVSKGKWIGFGDVRLGFAIGLFVSTPFKAMLVLFVASVVGLTVALPAIVAGKKQFSSKVPFGPLLIIGLVVTMLWGQNIVDWYSATFLYL